MSSLLRDSSLVVTVVAVAVVGATVLRALRTPDAGRATLAAGLALALEFFVAAGLIRLSTLAMPGLGLVAAVVAVRQVIGRGLRSSGPPPSSAA